MHDPGTAVRRTARMRRRRASREPGHRQIETAPEEVDGADLADEASPELMEHAVALHQAAPEPVDRLAVIAGVFDVLIEGRVEARHLDRHRPHPRRQPELVEVGHELVVEVGHGPRLELHRPPLPVVGGDAETMVLEVEVDLEGAVAVRDRRRGEAGGRHVQRHVPPVVHHRRVGHADLADDLRP